MIEIGDNLAALLLAVVAGGSVAAVTWAGRPNRTNKPSPELTALVDELRELRDQLAADRNQ